MEEHRSTQDADALVAEFNSEIQDVLDESDRAAIVAELDTNIWKRRNSKLKSSSRGISGNSGRLAKASRTQGLSSSKRRKSKLKRFIYEDSSSDDDSIIELAVSMVLNFDGETYSFTQPMDDPPSYLRPGINKLLDRVIGEDHPYQINNPRDNSFNHLDSRNSGYLELCSQTECIHVEICCIVVKRNIEDGCLHIQGVDYRSTFSDGSTKLSSIDCVRSMSNPFIHYLGGRHKTSRIKFTDGEYLAEVRVRHGENRIIKQITFITNRRIVSVGGGGGRGEGVMPISPNLGRRVVALVGTLNNDGLEKLGIVSVSHNWEEEVGSLVLLRALVDKNRASLLKSDDDTDLSEDDVVVQRLVMNTDRDIFRRVVSFLGHGMNVG